MLFTLPGDVGGRWSQVQQVEPELRVQTDLAVLAQPLQADDGVLPQLQLLIEEQS